MSARRTETAIPRRTPQLRTRIARTELLVLAFIVVFPILSRDNAQIERFGGYFLLAIFAISVDLIWGYGGMFTFGHAAFFGGGGYVVGILTTREGWFLPLPLGPAILLAVACGAALALAMSYFVFSGRLALRGVEFAVVTLAVAVMLERLARAGGTVTGGQNGILMSERLEIPGVISVHKGLGFYVLAAVLLVGSYWLLRRFTNSDAGLVLRGVRSNEDRIALLGYDVARVKRRTFVLSGGLAAFAGSIYFTQFGIVSPTSVGITASTLVLLWVVLGGRGTLIGPIVGAVVLQHLTTSLSSGGLLELWLVIVGAILIVVIVVLPSGIFGFLGREQ